jgi:hypothetical protein
MTSLQHDADLVRFVVGHAGLSDRRRNPRESFKPPLQLPCSLGYRGIGSHLDRVVLKKSS